MIFKDTCELSLVMTLSTFEAAGKLSLVMVLSTFETIIPLISLIEILLKISSPLSSS